MSYLCVFKRSLLGVKICLRVKFKISDEHPRLFHMGVPPPPGLKVPKIRHFHVEVVQLRRQGNVQKTVMHVQSCCFAYINLLLFCRSC